MEVKAVTKYARIAPKKARDLAREIQGRPVSEALNITDFSERKAAKLFGKTLKSAIANAEHNNGLSAEDLVVKLAVVEDGPILRRGWYGARGMFKPIAKRTSHIRIILSKDED
ncbi:MAG: 50S ribosomal protein L22 [Verrucomicrobiota bacterium]|jgi:large subunit ribosomal protein L22